MKQIKLLKMGFLLAIVIMLNSCASGYQIINPNTLNYNSNDTKKDVTLYYKYNLLNKKYAKKETKKGVQLVAIKIINNSEKDIVFGKDVKLEYTNGNELYLLENEKIFKRLKQRPASYLFYLLLTPLNLYITKSDLQTETIPIGLAIGPGLAGGNMLAASSANKKFKNELLKFDIKGATIKKGESKSGLIGIKSDTYDAIKIKLIAQ